MMVSWAAIIFLVTYVAIALGGVPGLALDRTGVAVLGAIAMLTAGALSFDQALQALDVPTLLLLYALMVVSAQLRLGGFYTWVTLSIARWVDRPRFFLGIVMVVSALLSALLANDIICLAFTPVLILSLHRAGLNPLPFLLGLAAASNIGSAATLIGNPQNMLIGQLGRLDFAEFFIWCGPPSLLALIGAYLLICWFFRSLKAEGDATPMQQAAWPALNRWQTAKGLLATAAIVALFFTPVPRELSAIGTAGVLLCSRRMATRALLGLVDWHLITLFCGLFVVIGGIQLAGIPAMAVELLLQSGIDLHHLAVLAGASAALSNVVSNVPATMLLVQFLDPAVPAQWYTLALSSTFAGNLLLLGSIANLIVIEQAKAWGVSISFWQHARAGIPITLLSLLILLGWIWVWS